MIQRWGNCFVSAKPHLTFGFQNNGVRKQSAFQPEYNRTDKKDEFIHGKIVESFGMYKSKEMQTLNISGANTLAPELFEANKFKPNSDLSVIEEIKEFEVKTVENIERPEQINEYYMIKDMAFRIKEAVKSGETVIVASGEINKLLQLDDEELNLMFDDGKIKILPNDISNYISELIRLKGKSWDPMTPLEDYIKTIPTIDSLSLFAQIYAFESILEDVSYENNDFGTEISSMVKRTLLDLNTGIKEICGMHGGVFAIAPNSGIQDSQYNNADIAGNGLKEIFNIDDFLLSFDDYKNMGGSQIDGGEYQSRIYEMISDKFVNVLAGFYEKNILDGEEFQIKLNAAVDKGFAKADRMTKKAAFHCSKQKENFLRQSIEPYIKPFQSGAASFRKDVIKYIRGIEKNKIAWSEYVIKKAKCDEEVIKYRAAETGYDEAGVKLKTVKELVKDKLQKSYEMGWKSH
ncbi:MAG: hypothetical protein LBH98_03390 [Chitinispirillales bacterium]|nr:hypothetical protein [Chitinispirillales bacterium]